jgi:hypothetical protein
MPVQTQKSALAKLDQKQLAAAHAETANTPAELGQSQLPPGIEGGTARVVKMKFGEIRQGADRNAGEPYFYAEARVLLPKEFTDKTGNKHHVEGGITKIQITIADRKEDKARKIAAKPWTEFFKDAQNVLKMFAPEMVANVKRDANGNLVDPLAFDKIAEKVAAAKPFVKFRTWAYPKDEIHKLDNGKWRLGGEGNPVYDSEAQLKAKNIYWNRDPLTNHQWQGACDAPEGIDEGEDDLTGQSPSSTPTSSNGAATASTGGNANADGALTELVEKCSDPDDDIANKAIATLKKLALDAGVAEKDFLDANEYADVIPLIEAAQAGGGGETVEDATGGEDEEPKFKKGQAVKYRPQDPNDKKKRLKAVECIVQEFDKDAGIVTVKDLAKKKVYKVKADDKHLS